MSAEPAGSADAPVLLERHGTLGLIKLNQPKSLNALTLAMVRAMTAALDDFESDAAVASVLLMGAGERGLCAGGDINALYNGGQSGSPLQETFLREEYRLDARIAKYGKPYIAFMDGITMGGGIGISAHGAHRLVTEATRIAMPEVSIGFIPDVGGTRLLSRAPGETGTYLALTGQSIGADDAIYAGFADVSMPRSAIADLIKSLSRLAAGAGLAETRAVIADFVSPRGTNPLDKHRELIDRTMHADTVEAILDDLAADGSPFATATREALLKKSPTSLKFTLRLLRLARAQPALEACLSREFAAAKVIFEGHDFYEGVRAAIIDKDRNPRWSPARLEAVDMASLDAALEPFDADLFPAATAE